MRKKINYKDPKYKNKRKKRDSGIVMLAKIVYFSILFIPIYLFGQVVVKETTKLIKGLIENS